MAALPEVVADNAEYEVDFALDPREGWDISLPITALFVRRDGSYTARILDAGETSCTMPPQTGTNIVFVGLTQDDMRTTTPATIKVHRSIRTVAHDPLPEPSEDVYAQILEAYAGVKILSGKGAPTSETQGKVNQLYRDEDTQRLYICTATDGGYTWAEVSGGTGGGSVDVDDTLTKAGQAADAKAAGDAIGKKIDKAQGTGNAGKILGIDADGNVTPQDKPVQSLAGAVAPTTATAGVVGQEYYVIVNNAVNEMYVCTAVTNGTYTWDPVEFGAEIDDTSTEPTKVWSAEKSAEKCNQLSEEKVSLPKAEDGTAIPGTAGWYAVSDGAGGITWVESAPSTGGGGETTTHGIVWNLVNVTSSNNAVSVANGASLVAVLTPADGYTLGDVTITMGGEVVTGAWNADTATVTIQSVTGDVIISCAGVAAATEEEIAHTWSNGAWKYDTATETWTVDTSTLTRCCIQQTIDATDGYLKIRFNLQTSYDQYMQDPATDCPMVQAWVADGIMNLATTKLRNLGNAALVEVTIQAWQKLEWDTDYYLPAGYIYRIQVGKNIYPYVLDEDSFAFTKLGNALTLGSSNANFKSIVTTDGFCTITKITGNAANTEVSVASSVDAQYTQELGISTMSLVPDDVESEPTTYTGIMKKAISEWMIAYKGDTRKIPVIIHTDQHGRLSSASKPIFTSLGNLVPWYDVSKIMNLGDCVGDHWEDADTENPFLSCGDLETMMECLADIPISKRLDVYGNHDTWYHDADGNDVVVPDQARLSQYFRNIFARNPNSNQQGYFVDYDNKYNVKYVVVSGFEYTTSRSTYRISTAQMKWIISEMSKDDGYDIVVVSHAPLYYQSSTEVFPTGMTPSDEGSTVVYRLSNVDTDGLFNARKNKTSGTVTDSDGVEHTFDFSGCTTDILCGLHGHMHIDAYNYAGGEENGLLNVTFDWFADNTMHFVLVDRVNRQLNVWKVDSTNTVQNYQVPLDKATE